LPQVRFFPVDTDERRNGWYVLAFSLNIEEMNCNIRQFVEAAGAEGAPCWKVFWPQCHTERAFREHNSFGRSGFPFRSREYADRASTDYSRVEVPNSLWHESHTFTCFAYPTFDEEDMQQIADALTKVIKSIREEIEDTAQTEGSQQNRFTSGRVGIPWRIRTAGTPVDSIRAAAHRTEGSRFSPG
jgi:dTDP-4-amino-4,6-dideoxygalactose transaminase